VKIESSTPVYGAEFTLDEKIRGVEFAAASKGTFLSQNGRTLVITNSVTPASVEYGETRIGSGGGIIGSGTLATITVSVSERVSVSEVSIGIAGVTVADPDATAIATTVRNYSGTIEGVSRETPTPTETDSVAATPTETDTSNTGSTDTGETTNPGGSSDGENTETQQGQNRNTVTVEPKTPTEIETPDQKTTPDNSPTGDQTTPTQDTPIDVEQWEQKVDAGVTERINSTVKIPVIIQIEDSSNLTRIAGILSDRGLGNSTVNTELGVVLGRVTDDSLGEVAAVESVRRIRYDTTAETSTTTQTRAPTATPTQTNTETESGNAPTQSGTQGDNESTSTPSASGPGFGILTGLLGVLSAIIFRVRHLSFD
jgi:hypothetical protein